MYQWCRAQTTSTVDGWAGLLPLLQQGPQPPVDSMFEDVYKDMPWYLQRQRDELKGS